MLLKRCLLVSSHLFFFLTPDILNFQTRCGIVLCARDAKFAVECDTCKLSYCLVCLASGQKEPCIRCGHRPSKRMEQLVHLRLKSIYKAFQQSARTSDKHIHLKRAALAAQKKPPQGPKIDPAIQQAQADAAAASLLKELEEEEEAEAKKQNAKKKKKRKKKKGGDGEDIMEGTKTDTHLDEEDLDENSVVSVEELASPLKEAPRNHPRNSKSDSTKHRNPSIEKRGLISATHQNPSIEKRGSAPSKQNKHSIENRLSGPAAHQSPSKEQRVSGLATPHNQFIDKKGPGASTHQNPCLEKRGSRVNMDIRSQQRVEDCPKIEPRVRTPPPLDRFEPESQTPPLPPEPQLSLLEELEENLLSLVTARDIAGIENLLEEWKGVPGRAVLRKNAKKARKKLMEEEEEKDHPLLKVVSSTSKSKAFEVVLEMAPIVVGWVIGKGGVKIRDLMEDSGAKVWIDQESMLIHEPRIVYVSGPKNCVEVAVSMIQNMVKDAPKDGVELPNDEEVLVEPQLFTKESLKREDSGKGDWAEHKMTCEAGFVPLLIGKRGWTIKHIQDSSGAKVDIDQNVTPRVVTITGRPESVQTAIRLVRDVLSYPQGQLQRKEDEEDILEVDFHNGAHSPPPSSLIMMSTISASSSLSSTPEPSMASSKQGKSANDFTHQHQQYLPQPPGVFDNRLDTFPGDAIAGHAPRQLPNFQHAAFSRQHLQQEFVSPQMGYHHSHLGSSGVSGMAPPGLGRSLPPDAYIMHRASPQSMPLPLQRPPMSPSQAPNHYHHQQHHQQQINLYQQSHGASTDPTLAGSVNQIGQNYRQEQNLPQLRHHPSMWEGQSNSAASYGVSSIISKQTHSHQQLPPGSSVRSSLPPNLGASLVSTQDDSNLVDSLFGPSGSESNLLDDLQGLNINSWGGNGNAGKWNEEDSSSRLVPEQNQPSESRFNWEKNAG
jgi:predicted  nucleic acid-binding Zn-ribbon protein